MGFSAFLVILKGKVKIVLMILRQAIYTYGYYAILI